MQREYEPVMKNLIKLTVRTFYEPHHAVITDLLLDNILLSDSEFCMKMKMLNREFNKLIVKLRDDGLIKHDIKVEVKEEGKQLLRTVYFFNFVEVRDIIKYKIYKMSKALEVKLKANEEVFYCKDCDRKFKALDAQAHMENFVFKCMFCKNELIEYSNTPHESGLDLKELLVSIDPIIKLLKASEAFEIPSLDYFQILEIKRQKESKEELNSKQEEVKKVITPINIENNVTDEGFDEPDENSKKIKRENVVKAYEEFVFVKGIKKKISEITEEDKNEMTEDEYIQYFDIFSRKCN